MGINRGLYVATISDGFSAAAYMDVLVYMCIQKRSADVDCDWYVHVPAVAVSAVLAQVDAWAAVDGPKPASLSVKTATFVYGGRAVHGECTLGH